MPPIRVELHLHNQRLVIGRIPDGEHMTIPDTADLGSVISIEASENPLAGGRVKRTYEPVPDEVVASLREKHVTTPQGTVEEVHLSQNEHAIVPVMTSRGAGKLALQHYTKRDIL